MNENVSYWINIAQYDLDTAKAMLSTQRYLYVGFMCHQTVEKSLKAVIASMGEFPPKIHNLIELSKLANLYNKLDDSQKSFIRKLNPLNIEARYPSYISNLQTILTPETCMEILLSTKEWFKWIENQL